MAGMVEIVTRWAWRAKSAQQETRASPPFSIVFSTLTYTPPCDDRHSCKAAMRVRQNTVIMKKRFDDIQYNFVICGNGLVYEGRGFTLKASLPRTYEAYINSSLYIAYLLPSSWEPIPNHMQKAHDGLLDYAVEQGILTSNYSIYKLHSSKT